MKTFNFIYKTTNKLTSKKYIGFHSTDNLDDSYLGSGVALNEAIKKYGRNNFEREILEFIDDVDNHLQYEEKWILQENTLSPYGYNLSPTGGLGTSNSLSDEIKERISKSCKGRTAWNKGIKGKAAWNKGLKLSKLSDEHKAKISKSCKGKNTWVKGKKLSEEHKQNISNGLKGRIHSNETKEKIKAGNLGQQRSEKTKRKISNSHKGKKHSEETKRKMRESHRKRLSKY